MDHGWMEEHLYNFARRHFASAILTGINTFWTFDVPFRRLGSLSPLLSCPHTFQMTEVVLGEALVQLVHGLI